MLGLDEVNTLVRVKTTRLRHCFTQGAPCVLKKVVTSIPFGNLRC